MIHAGHRFCLVLLTAMFASGCSSSPMSRIDANRALYESWPFEVQEAVLNGRVVIGMTPEMVQMVLGKPSEVMARAGKKGEEEVWIYKTGGGLDLLKNSNISLGGSIGGVGSAPVEDEHDVVFQNGVVVRADPGLTAGK